MTVEQSDPLSDEQPRSGERVRLSDCQTKRPRCKATGAFLRGAGDGLLSRVLSDGVPSAL